MTSPRRRQADAAPSQDPWEDPRNWHLGVFYAARDDRRLLVPKRLYGAGWTLNFARPLAWVLLVAIIALALAPLLLLLPSAGLPVR